MVEPHKLSRRERQIMQALYASNGATVAEVLGQIPNPPTDKAVRRMLQILEEKGHVRRRKVGREYRYRPVEPKSRAGARALRDVLNTFFNGSVHEAVAMHLRGQGERFSDEELAQLQELIDQARAQEPHHDD